MDFGSLLSIAQQNSQSEKKSEVKCYVSKFEPPKKEKKETKLSKNIQKFLAKRDEEEREKAKIAREKRDQLLSMRDTKAKNKISKMLKVIKSANKSVLDDAVDHDNTAVTMEGPDQPDEDDYGYVSHEASQLYSKLMEKYKSIPDEKKFDFTKKALSKEEIKSAKERVREAIHREQEEENAPHRRQRHSKSSTDISSSRSDKPESSSRDKYDSKNSVRYSPTPESRLEEKSKAKKRPPPPPAMDFQQLLKLAEQKQHQPIEIKVDKKEKEPERLMTQKEKREMEERRSYLEAKEKRRKERENPTVKQTPQKMEPNGRIPKLNGAIPKDVNRIPKVENNKMDQKSKALCNDKRPNGILKSSKDIERSIPNGSKLFGALTKPNSSKPTATSSSHSSSSSSNSATRKPESSNKSSSSLKSDNIRSEISSSKSTSTEKSSVIKSKQTINTKPSSRDAPMKNIKTKSTQDIKTRQFPPADIKTRHISPADSKPRQFPPPDVRGSKNPKEQRKLSATKRRILDSDSEEYDSEMDDFIDDGPEDENNYSKYISEIFGYDKKKFRDEDYDDRQMESTFAQQMREEFISKKIGLMEDLEDMRQEALEKERKSQTKKRKP